MPSIFPMSWVWNPFAGRTLAPAESLAGRTPYTPDVAAACATAGDCDCRHVSETRGFLFVPVAEGTESPEVPQAIAAAANWEVLLKGFGLPVAIEATDANGKLSVNTSTGRILATFDDDDVAAMLPNSFGTVELWTIAPTRACLARRRYKAYP